MRPLPDHPALRSALITYLGNKRRLLPLIWEGLGIAAADGGRMETLADPFTGSGVVARLARLAGLRVTAADVEDYTRPAGHSFLACSPGDPDRLFAGQGGYRQVLDELNALERPRSPDATYFSRHYAPADTASADPDRERMFFTRENALRLDAMLERIHGEFQGAARDLLLAGVLVEMSIHNNTSGVMKGFHRGWGGRGRDALGRIMAPVALDPLPLIAGPRGRAVVVEAAAFPRPQSGDAYDIAYLDPPYTIHQYGANYHLLTSAVRYDFWDPGPVERGRRAGIREDHYRSEHCSRAGERARHAMHQALEAVPARWLLVSYNDDGIIDPLDMLYLLAEGGLNRVQLLDRPYHAFRGGKATRAAVETRELLFVVQRGQRQDGAERRRLHDHLVSRRSERTLRTRFLLADRWLAAGGSVVPHGEGFLAQRPDGTRLRADASLRVRALDAGGARHLEHDPALSDSLVAALESAIAAGLTGSAVALLARMKVRRYHGDRERLLPEVLALPLSAAEQSRIEKIVGRNG